MDSLTIALFWVFLLALINVREVNDVNQNEVDINDEICANPDGGAP